jgi:uncharacterized protein (DUF1697 family)
VPSKHIALIRGINVGKAKRVAMSELRTLVENLGYGDVRTLLNSGNVVFSTPRPAAGNAATRIEKALTAELGVSARITVLSAAELATTVAENPLLSVATDPSRLMVAALYDPGDRTKLAPLLKQDWRNEMLALGKRVAYVWCADGILESRLLVAVGRLLGDAVTTRNWATMLKLHALTQDNGKD